MNDTLSGDAKAELAADLIGGDFLYIARRLRKIQDETPNSFAIVAKYTGIGLRKAYALAQIDRCFSALKIDRKRLYRIGWSKLQILSRYITPENSEELLSFALKVSAHELCAIVREIEYPQNPHCVVLYLSSTQYEIFQDVLVAHGAKKIGRGLSNKELALTEALKHAQSG